MIINKYPLWKNLLVIAATVVALIYSLPNLYGEDPVLQISANRGAVVDGTTKSSVEAALQQAQLEFSGAELIDKTLVVRMKDTDSQLKAQDVAKRTLGDKYTVAQNLMPATPAWLSALAAKPMYLGLDLRGGVHFLMQVDMPTALQQADERYVNDIRTLLRNEKIYYQGVVRRPQGGVEVQFRTGEDREKGRAKISDEYRTLQLKDKDDGAGPTLIATITEQEQREIQRFAVQQNVTTLRNRVNELGVAEPIIQQQGADRIVVQLPGIQDTAQAKDILSATATLEFRMVDEEHNPQEAAAGKVPVGSKLYYERSGAPVLLQKKVIVTGDQITDAGSGIDSADASPMVSIRLDGKGAKAMLDTTKENVGKLMAVLFIENKTETKWIDNKEVKTTKRVEEVINTARIREPFGARFQITGLDSTQEARNLALLLRAGALSTPITIVEERTVGPSMGAENIKLGFHSTLWGFVAIAVLMTIYYLVFGFFAVVALGVNLLLLVAVLSLMQATLTLPGMAAIALTVGMAIDANVLILERIRDRQRQRQVAIHRLRRGGRGRAGEGERSDACGESGDDQPTTSVHEFPPVVDPTSTRSSGATAVRSGATGGRRRRSMATERPMFSTRAVPTSTM